MTDAEKTIGRDKSAVRALNFSGGGFDTIMQLGVAHALLVIQGRRPDVVVGVSAGAIHAAALCEIYAAGDHVLPEGVEPDDETYARMLRARVDRLRKFVEAANTSRERFFDSLLPDAYQIDSQDPLRPLATPTFARQERQARTDALSSKSGLVRLYNDLLGVDLSLGVITRVARGVLGLRATSEMRNPLKRWSARLFESARIWLLAGANLPGMVSIARPTIWRLLQGVFITPGKVRASTAGSIIFRFRFLDRAWRYFINAVLFLILLTIWVGVSLSLVYLPFELGWARFVPVPVLVALLWFGASSDWEYGPWRNAITAVLAFTLLLAFWGSFFALLLFVVLIPFSIPDGRGALDTIAFMGYFVIFAVILGFATSRLMTWLRSRSGQQPRGGFWQWCIKRLLHSYHLKDSLAGKHTIEGFLAELFDQNYYGRYNVRDAVEAALRDGNEPLSRSGAKSKKISKYADRNGIHLGLAVADLGKRRMTTVPQNASVVDGLIAALSMVPIFPPKEINGTQFVDATNIANVPTRALVGLLRNHLNPKSVVVHIYSVAPFPFSRPELAQEPGAADRPGGFRNLVNIAVRAIKLRRYRDATLERRLTELFTKTIPARDSEGKPRISIKVPLGPSQADVDAGNSENDSIELFRAWVTPVELERPYSLNARILGAPKAERPQRIAETIADGCRVAMEVMLRESFKDESHGVIPCRRAVWRHKESRKQRLDKHQALVDVEMPGSDPDGGPGLKEICRHCALNREMDDELGQTLRIGEWAEIGPAWPHELEKDDAGLDPEARFARTQDRESPAEINAPDKPVVSLLFSGGVFRGVFQMGVLNAINELGLKPRMIGGASVGTITSSMVARVFDEQKEDRWYRIAELAAVYLTIDRLVLTDKFADFVRNFTIRAAQTNFSLRQADNLFRRYDHGPNMRFGRGSRRVIAGIERLLYVNPYQLNRLAYNIRNDELGAAFHVLRELAQQFLDRMGVGDEILGAEPLESLINGYVLDKRLDACGNGGAGTNNDDTLRQNCTISEVEKAWSITLLATATNLTHGCLEIIGKDDLTRDASLIEALLASSAFPAVFRPRWSTDLCSGTAELSQYIDGGVMDNFPIDAVVQELLDQSAPGQSFLRRPTQPHLILAASLEGEAGEMCARPETWVDSWRRTKELSYNTKLENYALAEERLQAVWQAVNKERGMPEHTGDFVPLNVDVVTITPKWVTGTFAFHPMIGFRRSMQGKSIAHGCAAGIAHFQMLDNDKCEAWGITEEARFGENQLPGEPSRNPAERLKQLLDLKAIDLKAVRANGECWLRPGKRCRFSQNRKTEDELKLRPEVRTAVNEIHLRCLEPATHKAASR